MEWTKVINRPRAMGLGDLDANDRLVYGHIGRRIRFEGKCDDTRQEIADELELTIHIVKRSVAKLIRLMLLARKHRNAALTFGPKSPKIEPSPVVHESATVVHESATVVHESATVVHESATAVVHQSATGGAPEHHPPYIRDREYRCLEGETEQRRGADEVGEQQHPAAPSGETKRRQEHLNPDGSYRAFVGPLPSWEDQRLRRLRAAEMAVDEMRERDGYLRVDRRVLVERFAARMIDDEVEGRLRQVEGEEARNRWYAAENHRLEVEERERAKRQALQAKRMAEFRALPDDEREHWLSKVPMRSESVAAIRWRQSKGA